MLTTFEKIDKFYLLYTTVMVVMAFVAIYTFKTLFESLIDFNVIEQNTVTQETRINEAMLDEAYSFIFNKESVKLNVK